jgi:putative SOS response-associated peptidase YedK
MNTTCDEMAATLAAKAMVAPAVCSRKGIAEVAEAVDCSPAVSALVVRKTQARPKKAVDLPWLTMPIPTTRSVDLATSS